jgi:DNA-binding transcriptional LysR family regulator
MDSRKLLYMKAVVDHGSLSKAAKELHISQPALSTSMDRLEASLGVKLLDRGPTGVVPTRAGEMLYSRAWFIQDEIEVARRQIQRRNEGEEGEITAGAIVSVVANVIPLALCRWREDHPDIPFRMEENAHTNLLVGLLRTDLDFIIAQTGSFDAPDGIKQRVLFRDRLVIFSRRGHPIHSEPPTWSAVTAYPWVTHLIWRQLSPVSKLMAAEGLPPPRRMTECSSVSFMKTVIENSDHLGMLPTHAIDDEVAQGRLVPVRIESPLLHRDIAVYFRERSLLSEPSRQFLRHVTETGSRLCRQSSQCTHEASDATSNGVQVERGSNRPAYTSM